MSNRKLWSLVIGLGVVIVGLLLAYIFVPVPDRSGRQTVPADWVTYHSAKYGFEVRHPADWTVAVTEGVEPKINIYKMGEMAKPPFIHHNNVTQVSIFPKGVGTEGVDGETTTSTVKFAEPVEQATDFILSDGSRWATYVTFDKRPASWEPFGFVWASVQVNDPSSECVLDGQVLPLNQCDLGDRPEGAKMVLGGTINKADRGIEEHILATLRFVMVPGPASVRGMIDCLPHKGDGPTTAECAIGLKGDDGKYYGLLGLSQEDIVSGKWTTGVRVLISGTLAAAPESNYDIAGSITVRKIEADAAN
ncbi:MAG: hypothetical protein A2855_02180 [Candidatus Liptonbacteria bacterium RIFCSPHIGHO2_01_FULL_57_28]|uniref:Uncharacterized protein n=1 Tax=Candidatus Liptonbacteria bacterium RIFCSPHIGHO2_01_FULL_57_28 TaxID=1798647 RepID=A0A1G2CAQ0_9BACT|nr:MAG: hypothetical protein A2855_02180 [Candidatus Liptonbacteria bacterium RIFCSPHIGHO2_01_FULL_57_28]